MKGRRSHGAPTHDWGVLCIAMDNGVIRLSGLTEQNQSMGSSVVTTGRSTLKHVLSDFKAGAHMRVVTAKH